MRYHNILQIDDDPDDTDLFEGVLRTVSKSAYLAINNPLVALEKLVKGIIRPDVIVLDVNMPGMSGIDVLAKIKGNENTSGIPVIMFSTSSHGELKTKLSKLGADKYITKPNSVGELRKIILEEL